MTKDTSVKRILVVKNKHLGDIVLGIPAAYALHQRFPHAQLDYLITAGCRDLVEGLPWINEVIEAPAKAGGLKRLFNEFKMADTIASGKYDLFVDLTFGDRAMWYALLSGAHERWAIQVTAGSFLKPYIYTGAGSKPGKQQHTIDHEREFLVKQGIPDYTPLPQFPPTDKEEAVIRSWMDEKGLNKENTVVVHPTSRWLFKCWEDDRFAKLCDWLSGQNKKVVLTCGPSRKEKNKAEAIARAVKTPIITRIGDLSLRELAALMRNASLLIGVDSAPAHIASSVHCPSIILFGPSQVDRWKPYGDIHRAITAKCICGRCKEDKKSETDNCMHCITLDQIKDAIRQ